MAEARSFSPEASRTFAEDQMYTIIAGPDKDASCGLYDPKQHHFLTSVYNHSALQNWGFLVAWTIPNYWRDGTPDQSTAYAMKVCSANTTGTILTHGNIRHKQAY